MKYLFISMLGLIIGCAQGNCRSQIGQTTPKAPPELQNKPLNAQERVRVYKYDGSLQCGKGKAIALDVMAKDLKSISIYSKENKADGLMHIQMCGSPTGKANIYEIDRTQLIEAQKAGFKEWTWE